MPDLASARSITSGSIVFAVEQVVTFATLSESFALPASVEADFMVYS
jgi:hypothetical protein